MHKFIDNIVAFSLKNKFFIFFCTAIAVIAGAVSFKHTPIDAFPAIMHGGSSNFIAHHPSKINRDILAYEGTMYNVTNDSGEESY